MVCSIFCSSSTRTVEDQSDSWKVISLSLSPLLRFQSAPLHNNLALALAREEDLIMKIERIFFTLNINLDVNFHGNVAFTAVSGDSDHVSSYMRSRNDISRPDLEVEYLSETEIFISSNDRLG
ncbi:hypothetical protein L2E82_11582 [Cichorium intybus]|uniref:Uncharacterized protein n=1 Tax=Cichorium intybus TaxID=13427 RepID=A0ACB9GEU7_CICIN|nr:hypothetical protein L2E82_11582 [Cichorium intybus]